MGKIAEFFRHLFKKREMCFICGNPVDYNDCVVQLGSDLKKIGLVCFDCVQKEREEAMDQYLAEQDAAHEYPLADEDCLNRTEYDSYDESMLHEF